MENISLLNLFSTKQGLELPLKADSSKGGDFENMFKSYLDRSDHPSVQDTAEKTVKSVKVEEPDTPEEVIENLDIPQEDKEQLQKMLEDAETPEDISEFLDKMVEMIQQTLSEDTSLNLDASEILEEVETALADMAKTILSSETVPTPKDTQLLEQTLDRIVAVQAKQESVKPQLTVVKPENSAKQQDNKGENSERTRQAAFDVAKNSSDKQLTTEMKEKIVELVSRQSAQVEKNDTGEQEFVLRHETSEKVIKTEVRIESPRDIMKFADIIELAKGQKANKLNIQLHPQELGKVQIELVEQGGKITGKVFFESDTAKHHFATNVEALRQQLNEKGVIVESLEFFTKDFDQHEFNGWEKREGGKKGSRGAESLVDVKEDENKQKETDGIYA